MDSNEGFGSKVFGFTTSNAADLAATGVIAGATLALGYFGGKAALTGAALLGGGMFTAITAQAVVKKGMDGVISLFRRVKQGTEETVTSGLRRADASDQARASAQM